MHKTAIEGKEIILFGILVHCEHFFVQLCDKLPIREIIVNDIQTYRLARSRTDLPIRYCAGWKEYDRENTHIICCYQKETEKQYIDGVMEGAGLFYGEDYTDGVYWLSFFRREMGIDWAEREIWIFGAGLNGNTFYHEYCDKGISISGFVSNYENEDHFSGLPVIRPNELSSHHNPYIVICSDSWKLMSDKLEELGYKKIKDYCFQDWIPKRMFVAIGECQVYYTARLLCGNGRFKALYHHLVIFQPGGFLCGFPDEIRAREYGDICDVIFFRCKGFGNNELTDKYFEVIEKNYKGSKKIAIPFYYFFGQYIQATQEINPYEMKLNQPYYLHFRGDSEVNRLVEAGFPTEEIVEIVSDPEFREEHEIMDNLKNEIHRIKILDRLSSVKISDFVEAHYKEYPIFKDGTHFGIELSMYIVNQILDILRIAPFSAAETEQAIQETEAPLKSFFPIYPCVKKALGLSFGGMDDLYAYVKADLSVDWIDFKEYIRRYAEYVRSVKMIESEYGAMIW